MFRYAKNVRLVSLLQQAFQMALTGFLPVSLWLSMALCDSHSGSHWLSLPLSGKLWPSLAHYCSLISRIQPLIGSQGPCSTLSADAKMTHSRSGEGQLIQGLDLGLHLRFANVDELYARTSSRTSDGKVLGSLDDGLSRQHLGHDTWREGGGD